jgi:hypothetical protein
MTTSSGYVRDTLSQLMTAQWTSSKGAVQAVLHKENHEVRVALLKLEVKILENNALLLNGCINEPLVRFVICDPLTTIICKFL